EFVPHLDTWNRAGMYERSAWTRAGAAGLLCPAGPEAYGGGGGAAPPPGGHNPGAQPFGFASFPPPPASPGSLHRIFCTMARKSRSGGGCPGLSAANWWVLSP